MSAQITVNEWRQALQEAENDRVPPIYKRPPIKRVPAGFKDSFEWAQIWGYSLSHTMRQIGLKMRFGEMERRTFLVERLRGVFPVPHYRLKRK